MPKMPVSITCFLSSTMAIIYEFYLKIMSTFTSNLTLSIN